MSGEGHLLHRFFFLAATKLSPPLFFNLVCAAFNSPFWMCAKWCRAAILRGHECGWPCRGVLGPGIFGGEKPRGNGAAAGPSATACPSLGCDRGKRARPAERGHQLPRESGPQAYGVRWTSSAPGGREWADKAVGVSVRGTHSAASAGRKAAGSLAEAPRTAEEAAGNAGGGDLRYQPTSSAGTRVRCRSRLDRAQEARRPLNSDQPHPPWPAQRTGDRPRSPSTHIKRGRR